MRVPIKEIIPIERSLLVQLCGGGSGAQQREEIISRLREYAFRRVEHQVLFDCLRTMPLDRPELVRDLLPARLVLAGFPDFELAPFFEAGEVSEREARKMCRELVEWQTVGQERKTRKAGPSSLRSSG